MAVRFISMLEESFLENVMATKERFGIAFIDKDINKKLIDIKRVSIC